MPMKCLMQTFPTGKSNQLEKSSDVQPGNRGWHPTPVDKKEWHQVT